MLDIFVFLEIFLSFILEPSSGIWKQTDPFKVLLLSFYAAISLGLILLHYWGKALLDTLPNSCELFDFPVWLVGTGTIPSLWTLVTVPSNSFKWYFRQLLSMNAPITTHLSTWLGPSADLWSSLSLQLSSVLHSARWTPALVLQDFQLHPPMLRHCVVPSVIPFPVPWPQNSPYTVIWGILTTHLVCFLSLRDHHLLLPISHPFVVSGGKVKSVPITPSWSEARARIENT